MVGTLNYPNEMIPSSYFKMWLRTWSNDVSSGVNYLNDNFTLNFQNQTGTVSTTSGSAVVTGTGTNFTSADVGKRIRINGVDRWVASVQSVTQLTLETLWLNEGNYPTTESGVAYAYAFVNTWKDKSGSSFHVSQSTASAQPLLQYNAALRRVEVYFNGTGHFLVSNNVFPIGTGPRGFHCLYKKLTDAVSLICVGSQHSNESAQFYNCRWIHSSAVETRYMTNFGAAAVLTSPAPASNTIYRVTSFYQSAMLYSSAWFIRNNGLTLPRSATGETPTDIGSRYLGIARVVDAMGGSAYSNVTHVEMILHTYPSFTASQSAEIEQYMSLVNRHKY